MTKLRSSTAISSSIHLPRKVVEATSLPREAGFFIIRVPNRKASPADHVIGELSEVEL